MVRNARGQGPYRFPIEHVKRDPRRFRWPPRALALLGRLPDAEVARRAGCTKDTVVSERRRRGIAPLHRQKPPIEWTEAMLALLGTATDAEVGLDLGLHKNNVGVKRRMLGIPSYYPQRGGRRRFQWTERALSLLGRLADGMVARRLGVGKVVVVTERRLRGIPSFRPLPPRRRWTEEMLGLLGRESDRAIARRYGIGTKSVQQKRTGRGIAAQNERGKPIAGTARLKALLRLSNREVREKSGLSSSMARALRQRFGLPRPPHSAALHWPKRWLRRLGKASDNAIAAGMGVDPFSVWRKRQLLGIPPWIAASRRWTKARCALLGKVSDAELGRRMGITGVAVRLKRVRMRVPVCPRRQR